MENILEEYSRISNKVLETIKSEVKNAKIQGCKEGYDKGYDKGFNRGLEVGMSDLKVDMIDWDSIKIFAAFCYINGIDFSYMTKAEDKTPFTDRVINKFKESIKFNDISTESYIKYINDTPKICRCKICGNTPKLSSYDEDDIETYYFIECNNDECENSFITQSYDITDKDSKKRCIAEWNMSNSKIAKSPETLSSFDDVLFCRPKLKLGELIQLFLLGYDDKIYITIQDADSEEICKSARIIDGSLIPYYDKYIAFLEEPSYEDKGTILSITIDK